MDIYRYAVVGLVQQDNKFLVGKKILKTNHPLSEQWHIPGGKLDNGESEYNAVKRELKEETGIDVKVDKYIGEYIYEEQKWKVRWYLCTPQSDNLVAGDDLVEVKYVNAQELILLCSSQAQTIWPKEVLEYVVSLS